MTDKVSLRKEMLKIRSSISRQNRKDRSDKICNLIISSREFRNADNIYAYYPYRGEADICRVAEKAWERGKKVAFPKVTGDEMEFFTVGSFSELSPGSFGIMEPVSGIPAPCDNVLVIVPAVCIDKRKNRIGYGKGYYDRFLRKHPGVITMGTVYEVQKTDMIPAEDTDIPLTCYVTENGIVY